MLMSHVMLSDLVKYHDRNITDLPSILGPPATIQKQEHTLPLLLIVFQPR